MAARAKKEVKRRIKKMQAPEKKTAEEAAKISGDDNQVVGRISRDQFGLGLAKAVAKRATCRKADGKGVGVVIMDITKHDILAVGYNGSPPGEPHCIDGDGCILREVDNRVRCRRIVHAEINAAIRCKVPISQPKIVYATHQPCFECFKVLQCINVKEIHFIHIYGDGLRQVANGEVDEYGISRQCNQKIKMVCHPE